MVNSKKFFLLLVLVSASSYQLHAEGDFVSFEEPIKRTPVTLDEEAIRQADEEYTKAFLEIGSGDQETIQSTVKNTNTTFPHVDSIEEVTQTVLTENLKSPEEVQRMKDVERQIDQELANAKQRTVFQRIQRWFSRLLKSKADPVRIRYLVDKQLALNEKSIDVLFAAANLAYAKSTVFTADGTQYVDMNLLETNKKVITDSPMYEYVVQFVKEVNDRIADVSVKKLKDKHLENTAEGDLFKFIQDVRARDTLGLFFPQRTLKPLQDVFNPLES